MNKYVVWLAGGCLIGAWLVPLHFLPWVSWHSEVPVFVGVFLAALYGAYRPLFTGRQVSRPIPGMVVFLAAASTVVLMQAATGLITFSGDALTLLLYMALCGAAFWLGHAGASDATEAVKLADAMAWILSIGALASILIALAQVLNVWEQLEWIARMPNLRRPGGNMAQPNQLATLSLMGLASVLYLYEKGELSAVSVGLIATVLCLGLAMTESRTGALSFLMLGVWICLGHLRRVLRTAWGALLTVLIFYAVSFLLWPLIASVIHGAGTGSVVDINTHAGTRLVVWRQLLEAVELRPWFGWGLRDVSAALAAVVANHRLSEPFTYAHNIVLDLLIGIGVPMTFLVVALGGKWLWTRTSPVASLHSWYCVAVVLPVAFHALLEFPHAYAYFLAPVMFMLGVLDGGYGAKMRLRINGWIAAFGITVVALIGAWTLVEYVQIEDDFRVARFEAGRIGQTPEGYGRPHITLLTQLDALLEGARIVPTPAMLPSKVELARTVALRFPWPATQNRYALALALNGHPDLAVNELRVLRAMHGDETYEVIKSNWKYLGEEKYPSLRTLQLP